LYELLLSVAEYPLIALGFADEHALILYVYLSNYDDGVDDSVLTVRLWRCQSLHQANHILSITSRRSAYDTTVVGIWL
jgi:hypothetical protein